MGALQSCKDGWGTQPVQTSRRGLFELHPGRQLGELPPELLLDEGIRPPQKQDWASLYFTTSEDVIKALGPIGVKYTTDIKHRKHTVDLSYVVDPALLCVDRKEAVKQAINAQREAAKARQMMREKGVAQVNLKSLLVQYLRHMDILLRYHARSDITNVASEELDNAILELLNPRNTYYLCYTGRGIEDLMNWTWILTSDTTERAAKRLWAATHRGFANNKGRLSVPIFVFTLLLRRRPMSAEALRSLLAYAWEMMEKSETWLEDFATQLSKREGYKGSFVIPHPSDHKTGIKETVFVIMIIRLLRSATNVLPTACGNIVMLFARYLDGFNFRKDASKMTELTSEDRARLTYAYNTVLKLVSHPASVGPFESVYPQQQALFSLLRRMNQFQPSLIVDRRGYRAVVSMQLRHKKTLREREWARMKAKSWPPWKEERLGIDADIGVEHGVSRAMEVLRQSWEAGYAPREWENAASVLSGWDTDGSPTIQTRALHKPNEYRGKDVKIWTSRVRATRTLREAWSCFLSYKDQVANQEVRSGGASWVYCEMFEKIAQDMKRRTSENSDPSSTTYTNEQGPLPGDGIEVLADPTSPREAVFVRIPPPTLDEFVEMMARDKIKPGEFFLNTMLRHARSLETGLQYLEASILPDAQIRVLKDGKSPRTREDQATLESVSPYIFASFIRLLARSRLPLRDPDHAVVIQNKTARDPMKMKKKKESAQLDSWQNPSDSAPSSKHASARAIFRNPLTAATHLLLARKPLYRPAWYNLLRGLVSRKAVVDVDSSIEDQDDQDIKAWQVTCVLLNAMREIDLTLDLDGFHLLCIGLEKGFLASVRLSKRTHSDYDMKLYVERIISNGLPLLKALFKDVVRSKSMQQEIPASVMKEKTEIDAEEQDSSDLGETDQGDESQPYQPYQESGAFLPPGCLLPRLLEVPHPACLHAFVRVLGLRRDYDGLLDLAEWMSLFANELNAVIDANLNGKRAMRRCLTAMHVFLERSWITLEKAEAVSRGQDPSTVRDELEMNAEPAPAAIQKIIKDIVKNNSEWGGWPERDEVVQYCTDAIFI